MKNGKALFVSHSSLMGEGGGGVQWCTREYLATLLAAGIDPVPVLFETKRSMVQRILRKVYPLPYQDIDIEALADSVVKTAIEVGTKLVFLNTADAASLAPALRARSSDLRLIFFSHGVEVTDVVNNLRVSPLTMPAYQHKSRWIGDLLKSEILIREALDEVVCISEEDVAFEKWLGSKRALFLPRQIRQDPLVITPIKGRVGTVATLDHGPNLHGIRLLAAAMEKDSAIELRVVGGPEKIGLSLQKEFKTIKYVGRLSDEELKKEASTWCAFVNPIFCHARGASTKVATALGWGLPVLTTTIGARGYRWNKEILPLTSTPDELRDLCIKVALAENLDEWINGASQIAALAHHPNESGGILGDFLTK